MKQKKIPISLSTTEKLNENKWDKTKIVIRTEEEINNYKKSVGYRKSKGKKIRDGSGKKKQNKK